MINETGGFVNVSVLSNDARPLLHALEEVSETAAVFSIASLFNR
jgi:hypothetical protein